MVGRLLILSLSFLIWLFNGHWSYALPDKEVIRANRIEKDTLRFLALENRLIQLVREYSKSDVYLAILPFYKQAFLDAEKTKNPFLIGISLHNLAWIYTSTNQYSLGLEYLYKARPFVEKSNNKRLITQSHYLEGVFLFHGNVHPEKGLSAWDIADSLNQLYKLKDKTSEWLANESALIRSQNDFRKQKLYYQERVNNPNPNKILWLQDLSMLSAAEKNLKNFDSALKYNQIAIDHARKDNVIQILGSLMFNRAVIFFDMGDMKKAEAIAKESLPLVLKEDIPQFTASTYGFFYDIYKATGNHKDALKYYEMYVAIQDSLMKLAEREHGRELEKKYETSLKAKTIAKQKAELAQKEQEKKLVMLGSASGFLILGLLGFIFYSRKKQNETRLSQQFTESELKALRAQMNPHFLFNSLSAIQQMVLNQETDNAFRYLDTYARLTRIILENSEKKWITVREEINFLNLYLEIESLRFDQAFQYQIEISEEILPHSDKIPAMLVQPIVENAIKHGLLNKPGEKKLSIRFGRHESEDLLMVEVEDNGLGRKEKPGPDVDHHKSMALEISKNRLALLDPGKRSRIETEDLKNEDTSPAGTRVRMFIFNKEAKKG